VSVTATGKFAKPVVDLAGMVAESATFQALCGVSTASAAAEFVHVSSVAEADIVRPYALCTFGEGFQYRRISDLCYRSEGSVNLVLEAVTPEAYANEPDASNWFLNVADGIVDDVLALGGDEHTGSSVTWPVFHNVTVPYPPARADYAEAETIGDVQQVIIAFWWGR